MLNRYLQMTSVLFDEPVKDAYLYCIAAQKNNANGTSVEVRAATMLQVFPEIQTGDSIYKLMTDFSLSTFPLEEGWTSHSNIPTRLADSFIKQYFRTTPLKRKGKR